MDPWLLENLVCPVTHEALHPEGGELVSRGHRYPVVDGVPVMLVDDEDADPLAKRSLERARRRRAGDEPELYLDCLGMTEREQSAMAERVNAWRGTIDPVVSGMLVATSGSSYAKLNGNPALDAYPIPPLPLPPGERRLLLDVGCNWGRWCISAARKGYRPVGIDFSLGGVMAARRAARQLGVDAKFVVGDVRYLPFREATFPTVFSYSVLQHLSREHVRVVLSEIRRVLEPGGSSLIQMAHWPGLRSLYHLARRGFREARGFEVRYWKTGELREAFESLIGESTLSVHCYFGLGLEPGDVALLPPQMRAVIHASELVRRLSDRFPLLRRVADSAYVASTRARNELIESF